MRIKNNSYRPTHTFFSYILAATALIAGLASIYGAKLSHAATTQISQIPLSATEIANPMRGQYKWFAEYHPAAPANWPTIDTYNRIYWTQVETSPGVYNFDYIEEDLAAAAAAGGRYALRIIPLCVDPGCANEQLLPDDLQNHASTWTYHYPANNVDYRVPDWNSPFYLQKFTALMQAVGNQFDGDPRLAYIDMGGYGNWGEGHNWPYEDVYPVPGTGQDQGTKASQQALNQAVIDAFPNTFKTLNQQRVVAPGGGNTLDSTNTSQLMLDTLAQSTTIGIRNDCLGGGSIQQNAAGILTAAQAYAEANGVALLNRPLDRWRIAPFVTEWCANIAPGSIDGTFAQGSAQVRDWHISTLSSANFTNSDTIEASYSPAELAHFYNANKTAGYRYAMTQVDMPASVEVGNNLTAVVTWTNVNVAPTYDDWQVSYQLRDDTGAVVKTVNSNLDLKTLYPGQETANDTVTIDTTGLSVDNYTLHATVKPRAAVVVGQMNATGLGSYVAPMKLANTVSTGDGAYQVASLAVTAVPAPEPPAAPTTPDSPTPTSPSTPTTTPVTQPTTRNVIDNLLLPQTGALVKLPPIWGFILAAWGGTYIVQGLVRRLRRD